ncbi:unnamed protein product [Moneuplotes crassus]|uniref:Uncharacterized protein n=1 Tax=Euplotes crassus TaxID=5936 RepID=A0AAD1X6Y3_EUPCR|nr:unnamed protein product [Moneuplotes crassus]
MSFFPACGVERCVSQPYLYLCDLDIYVCAQHQRERFQEEDVVVLGETEVPRDACERIKRFLKVASEPIDEDEKQDLNREQKILMREYEAYLQDEICMLEKENSDDSFYEILQLEDITQNLLDNFRQQNYFIKFLAQRGVNLIQNYTVERRDYHQKYSDFCEPEEELKQDISVQDCDSESKIDLYKDSFQKFGEQNEHLFQSLLFEGTTEDSSKRATTLDLDSFIELEQVYQKQGQLWNYNDQIQEIDRTLTIQSEDKELNQQIQHLKDKMKAKVELFTEILGQLKKYGDVQTYAQECKDLLDNNLENMQQLRQENLEIKQEIQELKALSQGVNDEFQADIRKRYERLGSYEINEFEDMTFKSNSTLTLTSFDFLPILSKLCNRCPNLDTINIDCLKMNDPEMINFLCHWFPEEVRVLHLGDDSPMTSIDWLFCCSKLLEDPETPLKPCSVLNPSSLLFKISPLVTSEIWLYNFRISKKQLESLIPLLQGHPKAIGLISCSLDIPAAASMVGLNPQEFTRTNSDLVFSSLEEWECEMLSLNFCGDQEHGNWAESSAPFENLIRALCYSEAVHRTWRSIQLIKCGIEEEKAREILDYYGFEQTKIL